MTYLYDLLVTSRDCTDQLDFVLRKSSRDSFSCHFVFQAHTNQSPQFISKTYFYSTNIMAITVTKFCNAIQISSKAVASSTIAATEIIPVTGTTSQVRTSPRKNKQVRFDFEAATVKEIPSLQDYNFMQLYQMYYKQSDYDYFRRTNGGQKQVPLSQSKVKAMKSKVSSCRMPRKMAHLILKQKSTEFK